MISNFVHLRNYTQYSLSLGALKINELINYCKKYNTPAIGISDFNNLFGSMEFSLECVKNGIQPIISCAIKVRERDITESSLLLIVKSEKGFQNISKLVSKSFLNNSVKDFETIDFKDLDNHKEGLICLSGGNYGLVNTCLKTLGNQKTLSLIEKLHSIFEQNFFIEIQREKFNFDDKYNNFLIDISLKKKIPIVATNENYFYDQTFHESHDALICIAQQTYIDSDNRKKISNESYLKTPNEMVELFKDIPVALENTIRVAKKCSFFLEEKKPRLPKVIESNENDYLRTKSHKGLEDRLKFLKFDDSRKKSYFERLNFELDVIVAMGYSGYFLIVSDFIQWAKKEKIPVGPGRGSGAGSLVAWALTITNLDPIRFGLIFERFLNPERISMPDFDIDFCMEKRDEVINYVQSKYDKSRVAQIITFGSFQARNALRDVGRVMQLPYDQIDRLCKLIPFNPAKPVSLKESIDNEKYIKETISKNSTIKKLFDIALNLEGLLRHASTHAAGVVISDKKLVEILPLYRDPKSNFPVTQFSMKYVEKAGLVKFDFLGLKTLTIISKTCKILKERMINIDIDNLPLDDNKTFELLRTGKTIGVFQFDGKGMRETMCHVKPSKFEDLIAIVSLYRPGPMDNIPTFIKRKNNNEKILYEHESLKPILEETYGIMVYQEQVMQIAQKLAGFSLAKADLLRRAMGKKIKSEMESQKNNFINGCKLNSISEQKAKKLFDEIRKFAGYGFNKSHAAAYAMVAYQTAFLKAHYPLEFFCASMQCEIQNIEKINFYCKDIKNLGFKIFPPDVNKSSECFEVIYDKSNTAIGINYALAAIKNIGENSIKKLVEERKKNGNFSSLIDLLQRVDNSVLNKRQLEALIYSGSLNSIEKNGLYLENNISNILKINVSFHQNKNFLQENLFNNEKFDYFSDSCNDEWDIFKKLRKEHDSIGFYLTKHPLEFCEDIIKYKRLKKLTSISDYAKKNFVDKQIFSSMVVINEFNLKRSRLGKKFAFLNISDDEEELEIICFSELLEDLEDYPKIGDICEVQVEVINNNNQIRLVLNSLKNINVTKNFTNSNFLVNLDLTKIDHSSLKLLLKKNLGGENKLNFLVHEDKHEIILESTERFFINLNFINNLKNINGITKITKIH